MNTIRSFLKLDGAEKLLSINYLLIHWSVRLMLWILPFSTIQNRIKKITEIKEDAKYSKFPIEKIIWGVNVSSRYTIRSTCLTRALTGQILLARYHYSSSIKIGVANDEGEFEAHAWLVHGDEIVLGESDKDYVPIIEIGEN